MDWWTSSCIQSYIVGVTLTFETVYEKLVLSMQTQLEDSTLHGKTGATGKSIHW